jgi:NADPH:quinone reductase-like Zn-dependent oxidoreductase
MKAVLSKETGGPETLVVEEIAEPKPGAGEVLVKVAACAINFPDTLIIRDLYQFKPPRPFAPGGEISGTVEALGEGVDGFRGRRPGDVRGRQWRVAGEGRGRGCSACSRCPKASIWSRPARC